MRSQYIVAGGTGLYENPGLVGMVYVYSKGFEVLTLPLCDLASHSYLTFFNLWLAVLGIGAMVWNAVMLTGDRKRGKESREAGTEKKLTYRSVLPGIMAAVLTVSVPGIMNMALTAKADLITWLLQLIMLGCFFQYIHVYENHCVCRVYDQSGNFSVFLFEFCRIFDDWKGTVELDDSLIYCFLLFCCETCVTCFCTGCRGGVSSCASCTGAA